MAHTPLLDPNKFRKKTYWDRESDDLNAGKTLIQCFIFVEK